MPTLEIKQNTSGGEDSTSFAVGQPSPTTGRLRIVALAVDGTGAVAWPDTLAASGYTPLRYHFDASSLAGIVVYKVLDGASAETGDITFTGSSENFCSVVADFSDFDQHIPPEVAFTRNNASADPDPPALNPAGWGTESTTWVAICGTDGAGAASAAPSSYTDSSLLVSTDTTSTDRVGMGWAIRTNSTASEDPGAFTRSSAAWIAWTVGIRPAPATPTHPTVVIGDGGQGLSTSATNHDISCVISANSDRRLLVFAGVDPGAVRTVSSVTLDPAGAAIALALITDGTTTANVAVDTDRGQIEIWELKEASFPSAGTYTLRVTYGSACRGYVNAKVIKDAEQSTNIIDVATATTSGALTLTASPSTGSTTDCLVVAGCWGASVGSFFDNGCTVNSAPMMGRGLGRDNTDTSNYALYTGPAQGTGTQTVTFGDIEISSFRGMIALVFAPAAQDVELTTAATLSIGASVTMAAPIVSNAAATMAVGASGTIQVGDTVLTTVAAAMIIGASVRAAVSQPFFDTQLLIRQPQIWPSAATAEIQIGGIRNTNDNADPHEEKAAIFCSRIVNGTVYHYAELLNSPVTETYLMSQADHNSALAFTGSFARLLNPADFTSANSEAAITSIIANPWGAGVVAFLHCGNNAGTRQIYYATSTSDIGAVGTWTVGNSGNAIITVTGGETRIADGFAVYDPIDDVIRVFHRTHDAGGLSSVHLATVNSSFTATRQGVVIADTVWSAENGVVPGQIYESASGVYQMFVSPNSGNNGPRHAYSTDYGETWTVNSTVAASPQGGTSVPDALGIADGLALWYDERHPETISVMAGAEVSSGSITDVPFRGRVMFHTAYPKALASIVRHGRFYGRDNGAGRAQSTFTVSTSVMNSSAWMVAIETRARATDRNLYRELFTAYGAFNVNMYVRFQGGGSTDGGKVDVQFRVGGTIMSITSTNRYDDGALVRIGLLRNSSGSWELWVNGTNEGTSATDPGVDATSSTHCLGNWPSATGEPSEPALASVRAAYLTGAPPSSGEAQAIVDALNGTAYSGGTFQFRSWVDSTTDTTAVANVEMQAVLGLPPAMLAQRYQSNFHHLMTR